MLEHVSCHDCKIPGHGIARAISLTPKLHLIPCEVANLFEDTTMSFSTYTDLFELATLFDLLPYRNKLP